MIASLKSIGDRLWDATQTVGDFLSGGKTAEIRGERVASALNLGKEEVEKRAKMQAEDFLPMASILAADRDSLASQRNEEAARILRLPTLNAQTGAGTLAGGISSGAGQVSSQIPAEIPPSPTAFQLAKQLSNQQIVEELLKTGIVQKRNGGVMKGALRGIQRGLTLGISGQRDMESPYVQAQLANEPLTKSEKMAEVAGEVAGAFVPYSGIAKVVGSSLRTVTAINSLASRNPFLFGAAISNLGEELIDMSIRKGTGQEYNESDFILGMAMGGAFEGIWAGVRAAKNINPDAVRSQLNSIAERLEKPDTKNLFEAAKDVRIDGSDITYGELFRESRLAFFRQKGRPGIDRPANPDNELSLFHQTSNEAADKIRSEGFSMEYGKARLSDHRIPDGIYLKSTSNDIAVGSAKKGGSTQLSVKIPKGKTLELNNMDELKSVLWNNDDYVSAFQSAEKSDISSARKFDIVEKWFRDNKPTVSKASEFAKKYGIESDKLTPIRGNEITATDIEIAVSEKILNEGTDATNKFAAEARRIASNELQKAGYDYIHIKEDVGSFGRKTDNFIVLPHKIEELNQANFRSSSFIDQGTMLPREFGERRMPGLRGDEGFEFSQKKAREELESIVDNFDEILAKSDDYRSGANFAKAMRNLDAKGAFSFKNVDVSTLDTPTAARLLSEAAQQHRGKPIESAIQEVIEGRSKGRFDVSSGEGQALDEFENGFAEAIQAGKESATISDRVRGLIEKGYINPEEVIDDRGTTLVQLLERYEQNIAERTARAAETRSARKLAESRPVPPEPVAEIRGVPVNPQSEIRGTQLVSKSTKTDQEIDELLFEPTLRGHFVDQFRKITDSRYIESFGAEGKEIARRIDRADEIAGIRIGNDVNEMEPILRQMTQGEVNRFPDIAEGKIQAVTENEKALMAFWAGRRAHIANSAKSYGIEIKGSDGISRPFVPRENYYPRRINDAALSAIRKDPKRINALYESMVKKSNGALANVTEAKKIFNEIIREKLQKRFGNLEKAREIDFLPDEVLIRDPRLVLPQYLDGARRRLADAAEFGPNQEKLMELIEMARVKGKDSDTMMELVSWATGQKTFNPAVQAVSRAVRTYHNMSKLSLAAVTNLGDIVKPFVRTGEFTTTLRGFLRSFTQEGVSQARRSGAVEANLRALLQDAGDTSLSDAFFKYTGFTATETKIRQFNANSAIAHAEILVKRLRANPDNVFAYRRLAQWLDDPETAIKRGYLTQAEKDVVGFRGIADTQPIRRLDLPFYWQSPGGKILTQFKSFSYKHMTFMKKFIVDEARQGNVRPLLSFLILGQVVGESVADLKAFVRGRERDDDVPRRIIDNYLTIGGFGLVTDLLTNLQYGAMGGGFLKFVAGPTLTEIDDFLSRLQSKNRVKRLTEKAVGMVPVIGPAAKQQIFPTKQKYRARTIPIAEDIIDLLQPNSGGSAGSPSSRVNPAKRSKSRINPYR